MLDSKLSLLFQLFSSFDLQDGVFQTPRRKLLERRLDQAAKPRERREGVPFAPGRFEHIEIWIVLTFTNPQARPVRWATNSELED